MYTGVTTARNLKLFVGAVEARRALSRGGSKAQSRDPSRPPSAIGNPIEAPGRMQNLAQFFTYSKYLVSENHIDYFREPVVKSPPEPTRVKSPEQLLMRSVQPLVDCGASTRANKNQVSGAAAHEVSTATGEVSAGAIRIKSPEQLLMRSVQTISNW